MATPTDLIIEPVIEILEDQSFVMKWANQALGFRVLSQFATFFTFIWTNGKDAETGLYTMPSLSSDTRNYWAFLALFNLIGLPFDIVYSSILNLAVNGDTASLAQEDGIKIFAIATLVLSGLGTVFGIVANLVWQIVLWSQDIQQISSTANMWDVLGIVFLNFFDNIIYEGFKPAIFFIPVYSMLNLALPYVFYIYDTSN